MRFLASLSPFTILRQLRKGQESSTFERLSRSRHVADLRLIFSATVIIMIVTSIRALLFCVEHEVFGNWKAIHSNSRIWIWLQVVFAATADSGPLVPRYIALFGGGKAAALPLHGIDGDMPTDGNHFTSQKG
jgi:hypothetical protein